MCGAVRSLRRTSVRAITSTSPDPRTRLTRRSCPVSCWRVSGTRRRVVPVLRGIRCAKRQILTAGCGSNPVGRGARPTADSFPSQAVTCRRRHVQPARSSASPVSGRRTADRPAADGLGQRVRSHPRSPGSGIQKLAWQSIRKQRGKQIRRSHGILTYHQKWGRWNLNPEPMDSESCRTLSQGVPAHST